MEKLNSEELTKKVQEVKESKTHRLGGRKFLDNLPRFIMAAGMLTGATLVAQKLSGNEHLLVQVGVTLWGGSLGAFCSIIPSAIVESVIPTSSLWAEPSGALSEKRATSEVKAEVSDNAPAEKAVEKASKPKASKSQADKAMQTLMKNKQLARV